MTDLTPSNQKYANRVTEIWYAGKEFLRNKQLKGIKGDLSIEMVSRKYATVRSGNTGTRLVVETKREMKKRMSGRSPDLADSTFIALDAVRNYLPIRIGDAPLPGKKSTWRQKMSKFDVTAKSNNHYLPSTY